MRPAISSNTLKLLAALFMLIDHIGFLFFPTALGWRIIGRLSFPLFAFLIAEGFSHTSNAGVYAKRLIIFAALSQIPYTLALSAANAAPALNIFFTLSAGLLALALLRHLPHRAAVPVILCIALIAEALNFDYGAYGILTILGSYLFIKNRQQGIAALILLPLLYSVGIFTRDASLMQFFALLTIPFIALYNGERGRRIPRYLFYGFYPAHLFLLWIIWYLMSMS